MKTKTKKPRPIFSMLIRSESGQVSIAVALAIVALGVLAGFGMYFGIQQVSERVGGALADALQRLSFIVSALVAVFTAILPLYIASETRKGLKSDYIIVVVACLISLFILKLMTGWIVP